MTRRITTIASGGSSMKDLQMSRATKPARLTDMECSALLDVFTYFDRGCAAGLPRDDVHRICCMLGLNIARSSIPVRVKRSEFIAFVDNNMIPATGARAEAEVLAATIANGIRNPLTEPAGNITESAIRGFLEENHVTHSSTQVTALMELLSPYDQVRTTDTNTEPTYILPEHFVEGITYIMAKEANRVEWKGPQPHSRH